MNVSDTVLPHRCLVYDRKLAISIYFGINIFLTTNDIVSSLRSL